MPPGTGDVQLTLAQQVPLSGAVIVSTPQDWRSSTRARDSTCSSKVGVPVLGIVENMSYFICPKCGERSEYSATAAPRREAERLGVPFLGEVPLDMDVRADARTPASRSPRRRQTARMRRCSARLPSRTWAELEQGEADRVQPPRLENKPDKGRWLDRRVRLWADVRALGRVAACDEPVGRGAGPLARAAGDGRRQAATSRSGSCARSATMPSASPSTTGTTPGFSRGRTCSSLAAKRTSAGAEYLAELRQEGLEPRLSPGLHAVLSELWPHLPMPHLDLRAFIFDFRPIAAISRPVGPVEGPTGFQCRPTRTREVIRGETTSADQCEPRPSASHPAPGSTRRSGPAKCA